MPAGQNAADGYRTVSIINGNFTNLVSGLPLDSTKSTYLQTNSLLTVLEGGTHNSHEGS